MKKSISPITIGLGIASVLSGIYWIYNDGELLEILMPFIIGIGIIAIEYKGSKANDPD